MEDLEEEKQLNTRKLYKDVKSQIMKEFQDNYLDIRELLLQDLRKELKLIPLKKEEDNFFNKNPLITFAIFSIIVIFVFKEFIVS